MTDTLREARELAREKYPVLRTEDDADVSLARASIRDGFVAGYIEAYSRGLQDGIAAERERCVGIARDVSVRPLRKLKEPKHLVELTDDDGEVFGHIKRGATYSLDFREAIAQAILTEDHPNAR